ncbi:hypothetical protein L4C36_19070 [Photobacterium japonica]|uniref:hypothetical protein n=1 Tax=Photobacterium japonica TaxID=2910235 RepID=UPI003D120D65
MKNKTFFTLHTAIYGTFAFALFVLPAWMWPLYGVQVNDQYAYFLSQHNSIFLGGIAVISYVFRNVQDATAGKQLVKGLLFTNALGMVITLYAAITGIFTGFGWSDPAFFAVMLVVSVRQWRWNAG